MQPNPLSPEEQVYAIKTWRYLRLAMLVLVVGLGMSIGYERWKVHPGCLQRRSARTTTRRSTPSSSASYRNRYAAIAAAMVLAAIVIGIAGALGWDHWVLVLEATLISLFAVFWATRTKELWHDGLR